MTPLSSLRCLTRLQRIFLILEKVNSKICMKYAGG
jgi:hypothetical protein